MDTSCCGYSGNTVLVSPPVTQWIKVFKNPYDPGRGEIAVANWTGAGSANVNVSTILSVGNTYEVYDSTDYFGAVVTSGTYAGGTISIPIQARTAVAPTSGIPALTDAEGNHATDFKAFIIQRTGTGPTATPTNTGTFTLTPTFTSTQTFTNTQTPTFTPSQSPTATNTETFTPSFTSTQTNTPAATPTVTPTGGLCLYWHAGGRGFPPFYLYEPCGLSAPHPHVTVTPNP